MATAYDKAFLERPVQFLSAAASLSLLGGYGAAVADRGLSWVEHICFAISLIIFVSVPFVWKRRQSPPLVVATLLAGALLPALMIPVESGLGLRSQMLVWTGVCLTLLAGCVPVVWSVVAGIGIMIYLTMILSITPEAAGLTAEEDFRSISTWTLWFNYCALNWTGLTIGASARRFIIWAMSSNAREQEERRAESERLASQLENLISASPEALLTISPQDGLLGFANSAAIKMLNLDPEAVSGYDASTLLLRRPREIDLGTFLQDIADEGRPAIGIALDTQGIEIPISTSVVRSKAIVGDEDWFYVFAHDLRAERAYQQSLRRAERKLEEAKRAQSNARFAAGVAHDFANIMTIVRLCAEDFADESISAGDREENARALDQALDSADGLISELSSLSSPSRITRKPVEASPCLESVKSTISLTEKTLSEGIRLTPHYPAEDVAIHLPSNDLARILNNLIVNGAHALGETGHIDVDVQIRGQSSDATRILSIRVADDGPGIPESIQDQIFEPYFTTRERDGGTGLGLSTSRALLAQIGGTLELDHEHSPGACFEITIPIAGDVVSTGSTEIRSPATRKVLLVDDDELFRTSLVRSMSRFDYSALEAGDVDEAIEVLEQNPDTACVITDMIMPEQRGTDLLAWIASNGLSVGVIAISGWLGDDAEEVLSNFGDNIEFLQKPFDTRVLMDTIERVSRPGIAGD